MKNRRLWLLLATSAAGLLVVAETRSDNPPPAAKDVTVSLCDGETTLTVPGLKPGVEMAPVEAQKVATDMMQLWRKSQGEVKWAAWVKEAETLAPPQAVPPPPAADAGQPTKFTARDQMLWKREEKKWVDEGYKAFHNAKALGGTIGISCDMCHPNSSNTHPETYPKYQAQIKKVSLLRDMINWCIENPLKGKPLPENDPTLRAVEAYILSERKGVAIEPGKH
jgi:thiosulfate dehydrogenase